MKILLIEDDAKTAGFISKGLEQAGYVVEKAVDGESGLTMASTRDYDVAIVDVMLPKLDGFGVIEGVRSRGLNLPIIVLSARDGVEDRVNGLEKGGDDYLTKPFSFSELLARIQALLRRASSSVEPSTLKVGDLTMEVFKRRVVRGGERLDLQPLEYSLLEYLMRNAGRVVSKTMIMENVWEYNFDPSTNIVEARICKLRDKIDRPFERKLIHTVRGFGYVLEEESV
jgi:DNA-binding response OmpR family regulator